VQGSTTAAAPTGNGMSLYQAQQKLNRLGFDVGEPDGKLGPHTRAELKKFQRSRQIPATGDLDGATVEQLSR
jgi:peptidoglycan hydrolase-like protein with peptidoglycan-binding domain